MNIKIDTDRFTLTLFNPLSYKQIPQRFSFRFLIIAGNTAPIPIKTN